MDNTHWLFAFLLLPIFGLTEWGIRRWVPQSLRLGFRLTALVKVALGLLVGLMYANYWGGGDTWALFEEAGRLLQLGKEHPSDYVRTFLGQVPVGEFRYHHEPRALFTAALISIPRALSGGNYYLTSIWLSFFASWGILVGILGIQRAGYRVWPWLIGVCFWPSVAFWSAGIMKETFMLGLMGLIVGLLLPNMLGKARLHWWQILVSLLAFWLLWQIKYYAAGLLFAALGAAWLGHWAQRKWTLRVSWWVFAGGWLVLLLGATTTYPRLQPRQLLPTLYRNYTLFQAQSTPDQLATYAAWDGTFTGALLSLPEVLITGLFRPFLGENWHLWSTMAAWENVGLVVLVLVALGRNFRSGIKAWPRLSPLTVSAMLFVLLAVVLVGLGTPNFGTLLRYRVLWLPIVVAWGWQQLGLSLGRK